MPIRESTHLQEQTCTNQNVYNVVGSLVLKYLKYLRMPTIFIDTHTKGRW